MEFRPAHPSDAHDLAHIMHAAIDAHAPRAYGPAEQAEWKARVDPGRLRAFIEDPSEQFLVAEDPRGLVGFASRKGTLVRLLYVDPRAAGQGLGRRLMEQLEAEARSEGLVELGLDASKNAISFYSACGYEQVSTVGCGADTLLCTRMLKRLP